LENLKYIPCNYSVDLLMVLNFYVSTIVPKCRRLPRHKLIKIFWLLLFIVL